MATSNNSGALAGTGMVGIRSADPILKTASVYLNALAGADIVGIRPAGCGY